MSKRLNRRDFIQLAAAGGAFCLSGPRLWSRGSPGSRPFGVPLTSPGCRRSSAKVARLYMAIPGSAWPKPTLDLQKEIASYRDAFALMKDELAGIEFPVDELVTSPQQVAALKTRLADVDGILVIHLNISIEDILREILGAGKPTMIFAKPYSGHEWTGFGRLRKEPLGARMDCILSSDMRQLAVAVRPFRAIHHLREAKIMDLTTADISSYAGAVKTKFGTEIKRFGLDRMVAAYNGVSDKDARIEADRWMKGASRIVEPSPEDIYKSCKQALAFERILDEEDATVLTVDCYGTMWDKTIKLPAYPCLGLARLNNLGFGGICESDLGCAMTHIIFQGLVGLPSFVSDPTVDSSKGSIILAHCMGTPKMAGPNAPAAPYKIRTVMERQEGVVPQVEMRVGQKVTQGILTGLDTLRYFTGEIIEAPVGIEVDRGCRTKIDVKVDGDITKLWQNWTAGLHRQTVYGNVTQELRCFCRFKDIAMIDEAA